MYLFTNNRIEVIEGFLKEQSMYLLSNNRIELIELMISKEAICVSFFPGSSFGNPPE